MSLLKKLRKNRTIVLTVSTIVICLVYTGIQKAIENYQFDNNIVTNDEINEEVSEENEIEDLEVVDESEDNWKISDSEILSEETELVMEEAKLDNMNANDSNVDDTILDSENAKEINSDGGDERKNKIYIYITGEVNIPGVVILDEGSRIVDAINAAGGTTAKANLSKVNLVYVLQDGMKVNIPNNNDLKNNSDFEYITMNSGDGGNDDYTSNDSSTSSYSSSNSKNYEVVNINTATQTELETLPGIGPSLALKIINYRKENGKFASIEEIKNVSGIGESKFEKLKKYITV